MNNLSKRILRIVPILILLIFIFPPSILKGEQWPTSPENLQTVFGSDNGENINLSLNFTSPGIVRPFKEGEAVFLLLEENSLIPYNTGNSVVIEHSRGFRSYYTGLNRRISPILEKQTVMSDTILGEADSLGFYVKDLQLNCFVNPLPLLSLPKSKKSLQLNGVQISGAEGDFELKNGAIIPSGEYSLMLEAEENFGGLVKGVPHKIIISSQGQEVLRTVFDMIESIDGRFRLSGDLQQGYKTLYGRNEYFSPGYIRLFSGKTKLQIELIDLYGNKKKKMLEFIVCD